MYDQFWSKVQDAAKSNNPKEMLRILYHSGFIDGLERMMESKWSSICKEDLDSMVIAAAIDDYYEAVTHGKKVLNPGGYIFKAANNRASLFYKQQKKLFDRIEHTASGIQKSEDLFIEDPTIYDYEFCLQRCLQEARRLLPRLGQENVQKVMNYMFNCIEEKNYDVKPADIAVSLGIDSSTVRVQLLRGFKRLERIAKEEDLKGKILLESTLRK